MNIAVLGGGAVGLALAASLATSRRHGVSMLLRGTAASAVRGDGIHVDTADGGYLWIPPDEVAVIDTAVFDPGGLEGSILFVATKAYQVREALDRLLSPDGAAGRPGAIVLLQNGWGSADEARSVVPADVPLYSGVVLAGLSRIGANRVRMNGVSAPLAIGSLFGAPPDVLEPVVRDSAGSLLPLAQAPDIRSNMLHKLLLNTTMNATCTVTGMTYGEMLTREDIRPLALNVAREALDVLSGALDFRAFPSAASFLDDYLRPLIVPRTALHRPSMADDVREGRPTEIDYLNGAIVRMAEACGLSAPVNESLAAMIRARSRSEGPDRAGVKL